MLPIIIGIGAALILTGCSRREEEPPAKASRPERERAGTRVESESAPANPSHSAHPVASAWAQTRRPEPELRFDRNQCDIEQSVPSRFALQDPRQEYCRLHTLLTGGACTTNGNRIETLPPGNLRGLLQRSRQESPRQWQADEDLFGQMSRLEGLPIYLADGNVCEMDTVVDLQNLVTVYSLLHATYQSNQWRQSFTDGRMGCLFITSAIQYSGVHEHEIHGHRTQHDTPESHQLILTPAHLTSGYRADNPGFPVLAPGSAVSDCIEVR